jgi:hypothetical protein
MPSDKNPLKHPSGLFTDPSSELNALFQQTRHLYKLQQLVYQYLPLATQPHIRVAAYRDNVLHLVTDSAHWVTRLRYQETELMGKLKTHSPFEHLISIRLTVKPWYAPLEKRQPARQISASNAKQLVTAAQYIEDDGLRKALINLSLNNNMAHD